MSFSLFSLAPRAVAIAASGVVHATVLASLVYTTQGHAAAPAAELTIAVDTLEEAPREEPVPAPAPVVNREAEPETHHHAYPVPPSHDATPHDPSLVHVAAAAVTDAHEPAAHASQASQAEPLVPAPAPADAPVRFTIVVPPVNGSGPSSGASAGASASQGGNGARGNGAGAPDVTYGDDAVSARAKVIASAPPAYPAKARAEEVESDVPLEIVVDTQGRVVDAHVLGHAGYGFDESALAAIRAYRFSPAVRDGHAVRVRTRWTVQFRLR